MTKQMGLWIDHSQAVIVSNFDQDEDVKRITSTSTESHGSSEDGHDRHVDNQLNQYYDEVIAFLGNATSILILGPGEAKVQLQKRMEGNGASETTITVKPADRLTDNQIVAEIRQHFQAK